MNRAVNWFQCTAIIMFVSLPSCGRQPPRHTPGENHVGLTAAGGRGGSRLERPECPQALTNPLIVSTSCIGPLAIDSPLGALRRLADAKETLWFGEPGNAYPAVEFRFGTVVVVGTPFRAKVEDSSLMDVWAVSGSGFELANGVRFPATWAQVREHHTGLAIGIADFLVEVRFCDLPGITYDVAVPADSVVTGRLGVVTYIRASATITRVLVSRRSSTPVECARVPQGR